MSCPMRGNEEERCCPKAPRGVSLLEEIPRNEHRLGPFCFVSLEALIVYLNLFSSTP